TLPHVSLCWSAGESVARSRVVIPRLVSVHPYVSRSVASSSQVAYRIVPPQVPTWLTVAFDVAAMPRAFSKSAIVNSDTAPGPRPHAAVADPTTDRPNSTVRYPGRGEGGRAVG